MQSVIVNFYTLYKLVTMIDSEINIKLSFPSINAPHENQASSQCVCMSDSNKQDVQARLVQLGPVHMNPGQ